MTLLDTLQFDDGLDVIGLGEHVDQGDPGKLIRLLRAEAAQIAGKR